MAREKVFRFKQFGVLNDKTAMKVGTDGVLLGAWCDVAGAKRVLDVGTGSGVVALMIAERNRDAIINAIDIDEDAVVEAKVNFYNSPWAERLTAKHADFNNLTADASYDLIVSNPPFFTNGVLPPDESRNLARHCYSLSFQELITHGKSLMSPAGRLAIITPVEAELPIRQCVVANGMGIKRQTRVVPVENAEPKRFLWELVNGDSATVHDTITIQNANRDYTQQYINLTHDFYLKM